MTTKIEFRSDMQVELVKACASDDDVIAAARVSTLGIESTPEDANEHKGLIDFLVKNRHGSPFEHNLFKFRVRAPIFVWREHMRHRIASYNEESGRYKELEPVFYWPDESRALKQVGKAGHYEFEQGAEYLHWAIEDSFSRACCTAYGEYLSMLSAGVAREVARMVLPLNIYSTAYVSMNARALMNFLSLRTKDEGSMFPSFPQREIEMVAEQYELHFAASMPLTHAAFQANGRVAP